jgi:hypothetical protein
MTAVRLLRSPCAKKLRSAPHESTALKRTTAVGSPIFAQERPARAQCSTGPAIASPIQRFRLTVCVL